MQKRFEPLIKRWTWSVKPLLVASGFAMSAVSAQAPADIRVALIIGNAAYPGALALTNPANDAAAMAQALRNLGFTVVEARDASRAQMEDAVRKFFVALRGRQGVGMLYYAGHGLQIDWKNYMVPVDARLQTAKDVPTQTLDVGDVLDAMKAAGTRMNIVVLDACRDNPFAEKGAKGLAPVDAPTGTLLAYATAPGNVAEDGTGQNGLYTKHLLAEMQKPVSLESVFKRVRLNVRKESQGRQIPWESTSLEEDFFFDSRGIRKPEANAAAQRDSDFAQQKPHWDRIKGSSNPDDFFEFLSQYPKGLLSEIAQAKLESLVQTPVVLQPVKGGEAQSRNVERVKVGDVWAVRQTTPGLFGGTTDFTYAVERMKGDLLEINMRGSTVTQYMTREGALAGVRATFQDDRTFDPPIAQIPLGPFQVGHRSSSRSTLLKGGKVEGVFDFEFHVAAYEQISTPLGSFMAYRVEMMPRSSDGRSTPVTVDWMPPTTTWYRPNSAIPMKQIFEMRGRQILMETVSIKRGA